MTAELESLVHRLRALGQRARPSISVEGDTGDNARVVISFIYKSQADGFAPVLRNVLLGYEKYPCTHDEKTDTPVNDGTTNWYTGIPSPPCVECGTQSIEAVVTDGRLFYSCCPDCGHEETYSGTDLIRALPADQQVSARLAIKEGTISGNQAG